MSRLWSYRSQANIQVQDSSKIYARNRLFDFGHVKPFEFVKQQTDHVIGYCAHVLDL